MSFFIKKTLWVSQVIFIIFIAVSCNKTDVVSSSIPTPPGIALTFDDANVDNWHTYLNLFDSLGVKATFYISNFNKMTAQQKAKLHDIQNRGHEIAFHSTNHVNFVKYLRTNKCEKLISEEITKGLALMNSDGFYPTTFAYPYGSHSDALDKILLKKFKSVRALNGTRDLTTSLAPTSGNTMLFGLGIDEPSKRKLEQIEGLLEKAVQTKKCAVLLIHNVQRTDNPLQLPLWKLKRLILKAKEQGLKFYTISEISK